jgi:PKD repeat protein
MVLMKYRVLLIWLMVLPFQLLGQDCSIVSKGNDIKPDRLCSPVTVNWEVTLRGVNDGGKSVQIKFEWDDGDSEIFNANFIDPITGEWGFTANHTYTSDDDKCNYHPLATLIVNGEECTSSTQEQIVTVWDNDNSNGGRLLINPPVYPVCFGNSANVQFQDNTQFNCVPPQENDVPNVRTRWIQWIYGANNTMTGLPVRINGNLESFQYTGSIITLPGPVTGSGELSEMISVANDKLIGQYFEVTLRYWNFCNPYDDPNIPGDPVDLVNGDHPPETTTARILIVPYPDAEIIPISPICDDADEIILEAGDIGGVWSGPGITDKDLGTFSPGLAGAGDHIIRYDISDANACSDWDTIVIRVLPSPDVTIRPVDQQCAYNPNFSLTSSSANGTWSGNGITDILTGVFSPSIAGAGLHTIRFESLPDINGCIGSDEINIEVNDPPGAAFDTPDSSWCSMGDDKTTARVLIEGSFDLDYDLYWEKNGVAETITGISNDSIQLLLDNVPGNNLYRLLKVIENFGAVYCESILDDSLKMNVFSLSGADMNLDVNGSCSPVEASFSALSGFKNYIWDFGDGSLEMSDSAGASHFYFNMGIKDTSYTSKLTVITSDGCVDSIMQEIEVYPTPEADFFVSPRIQNYPARKVILNNNSKKGDWNYFWNFGDGDTALQFQPGEHEYESYGIYNILLVTSSQYCSDSIQKEITILPPKPKSAFSPDTAGCSPLKVRFKNQSQYAETYVWDFNDGEFSDEIEPEHIFEEPGVYHVSLNVNNLSGNAESLRFIEVYPDPEAVFSAFPTKANRRDQVFKFLSSSVDAVEFRWEFGDGAFSTEENPSYVYNKTGEFDVSLNVWSVHGCQDFASIEEYIKVSDAQGDIVYPNVFRWNESGPSGGYWTPGQIDNTVFHPHFENVVEYNLVIYSRWGELLFESRDLYQGWDGYLNDGTLAMQGVYVYKAWVVYVDGREEVRMGDVTFLH